MDGPFVNRPIQGNRSNLQKNVGQRIMGGV